MEWRPHHVWFVALVLAFALGGCGREARVLRPDLPVNVRPGDLERRFEGDIAMIEARERDSAAVREGIVFAGSSSFTRWAALERDMAPLPTANRGFGGSGIRQVLYYADRIILPLRPRVIMLYCGENDICSDEADPARVLADFKDFSAWVRFRLPETRIVYVSMKPSPLRWRWWPKFQEGNRMVRDFIAEERGMRYLDVGSAMLDSTGRPHRGIWVRDSLHMNEEGYRIWRDILKPVAEEELRAAGQKNHIR